MISHFQNRLRHEFHDETNQVACETVDDGFFEVPISNPNYTVWLEKKLEGLVLANNFEITSSVSDSSLLDVTIPLIESFGWIIKTGEDRKRGSVADIYAEQVLDGIEFLMIIDDGMCREGLKNAVYHIYSNRKYKIYEGAIFNSHQLEQVMISLGFKKMDEDGE